MSGWRRAAYRAARPFLFAADPELAHHGALRLLASSVGRTLAPLASGVGRSDAGSVELLGLRFRNRIGLAAGFDKDGLAIRGWAALGFGFVELGTVTPRPQPGNPRPRLFRLPADQALINRMGFNNAGADALARRIAEARPHLPERFVVGVNIGRNRDTLDAGVLDDYVAAARSVAGVADYLALNVSSPNTPGLRELQAPERLQELLGAVADAASGRPLLVKVSPDLGPAERDSLVEVLIGSQAAGIIVSNTTTDRSGLRSPHASEPGGLSGAPLLESTVAAVGRARRISGSRLAIVASGGIGSAPDVSRVIGAGGDLVELWTALIFRGPELIGEAVRAST